MSRQARAVDDCLTSYELCHMSSYSYQSMTQLIETVPSVYEQFKKRNFVVQKSTHVTMEIDRALEQMIDLIKGDDSVIGIIDNLSSFIKWITDNSESLELLTHLKTHLLQKVYYGKYVTVSPRP